MRTRNGYEFDADNQLDYSVQPDYQRQSSLLWLYSLDYLCIIALTHKDYELVAQCVKRFHEFFFSSEGRHTIASMSSADHMYAELIRSLCTFIAIPELDVDEECVDLLNEALAWASVPAHIRNNNHGMMLCLSALHAISMLEAEDGEARSDYFAGRLLEVFEGAFSSKSTCVENTPQYQQFYIHMMDTTLRESRVIGLSGNRLVGHVAALREDAFANLELQRLPDGSLPPLGDGNATRPKTHVTMPESELFDSECGFFCKRWSDAYFSMKCGSASVTHKQMDDNSIFLWYKGETILADAGNLNYDADDQISVAIKSQKGHSGPYFREYDELYPAVVYNTYGARATGELKHAVDGEVHVLRGTSTVDGTYTTHRTVRLTSARELSVYDDFDGPDHAQPCIRFLVPSEHDTKVDGLEVTIKTHTCIASIEADAGEWKLLPSEESGVWQAAAFNSKEPVNLLELTVPGANAYVSTHIVLRDV
ncbi:MAG: heparinase II/III family protein [Actinomycetaceae bacterium]|nr:heparinase II/III family protein [Arcanobacterium sp.]MDD7504728.1 heparinase II/III family protein [Actinomycetaceae bacterium]MDY6143097.1 heparinase II/III family protein [Arcanobacterium sp.]